MGFAEAQSSEQLRQRFREFIRRDDHCIVVADDGEVLVGYAWAQDIGPHLRSGDSIVRLHDLFVDEGVRLHGIGRSLFEFAREWARTRGARWLQWHAGTSAEAFYDALGITPTPSDDGIHPFYEIEFAQKRS